MSNSDSGWVFEVEMGLDGPLRFKTASCAKANTTTWGLWRVEELFSQQHNPRPAYTHAVQGRPPARVWLSQ